MKVDIMASISDSLHRIHTCTILPAAPVISTEIALFGPNLRKCPKFRVTPVINGEGSGICKIVKWNILHLCDMAGSGLVMH